MGEAKAKRRAHDTLDGGPPSDDRIVLMVDGFDPKQVLLAMDDAARLTALRECMREGIVAPRRSVRRANMSSVMANRLRRCTAPARCFPKARSSPSFPA